MIAVIVCGSRHWAEPKPIRAALTALGCMDELVVVTGGAPGADEIAATWVRSHPEVALLEEFPAAWKRHGKAAGFIRNAEMLSRLGEWEQLGAEIAVLAFKSSPDPQLAKGGTEHMVRIARDAGVRTAWFPDPPASVIR